MALTVLVQTVSNNLLTAVVLEVHVDVRHLTPFKVKEPFEYQPCGKRVNISDTKAVKDEARGGAAAHPKYNVFPMNEIGDVPDHEEVVREPGAFDHHELVIETIPYRLICARISLSQTLFAQLPHILQR